MYYVECLADELVSYQKSWCENTAFYYAAEVSENKVAIIKESDFNVDVNGRVVLLGDDWYPEIPGGKERELSQLFVGEVNSGDVVYKYYQHNYSNVSLYESNVNWNLHKRDVDKYIVS